ncbi:hypothetical protein [Paenarthrobacter nitroguajacolicus]
MGAYQPLKDETAKNFTWVAVMAAVLSGLLAGGLSFWGTTQTNDTALQAVKEAASENSRAERARLERDRKEEAFLTFLNVVDGMHVLRSQEWSDRDDANALEWDKAHPDQFPVGIPIRMDERLGTTKTAQEFRTEIDAATNKILLVVDEQDVPLVKELRGALHVSFLDIPPSPVDKTAGPDLRAREFYERFAKARAAFVNAYRESVLGIGPLAEECC